MSGDDREMHNEESDQQLNRIRASRIQELNKLDQNIAKLLELAGKAVQTLGAPPSEGQGERRLSIEERKKAFTETASEYLSLLSNVDVNLRRQILALEEAQIIPAAAPKDVPGLKEQTVVGPGTLGNLDVGWLNSRNDKIGKDMEAELWTQARELLEDFKSDNLRKGHDPESMDSS